MYSDGFEYGVLKSQEMSQVEIMDLIDSIDNEETILNGSSDWNMGFIDGLLEIFK